MLPPAASTMLRTVARPSSTTSGLCREEWIECSDGGLVVHAVSRVTHHELKDSLTGREPFTKVGFKSKHAASRHCIACIKGKVQDDLLGASRGNSHLCRLVRKVHHDLDLLTEKAAQ